MKTQKFVEFAEVKDQRIMDDAKSAMSAMPIALGIESMQEEKPKKKERMEMSDLILVENLNAVDLFTKDGVDPILDAIKDEVRKFVPDMTTAKGRKEIASMAHKVAKSKTYLDDLGKKLVEDQKRSIKIVDESRKKIRDELDALKDEVRKPLTEWEEKEEARIQRHKIGVEAINQVKTKFFTDSTSVKDELLTVEALDVGPSWEEFEASAKLAKAEALTFLGKEIERLEKLEAEQAELKRLREESAKREQEDRERKLKEEAAAKAKKEAEEEAAAKIKKLELEKEASERKAKEEREQAEKEKRDAKEAQDRAERNAEIAKQEKIKAAKLAELQKEQAEKKAIEDERARVQAQKEKEEAEQKKREANKAHMKKINNEALSVLLSLGASEELGKALISAIAKGEVPHVSIKY